MNPMDTLSCLDELQNLGFTDAAFSRLHHFREKQRNETIIDFRQRLVPLFPVARLVVVQRAGMG